MKAPGSVKRANGLASYAAVLSLLAAIAFGLLPFSTPAVADDRPRPPAARDDDVLRQRERARVLAVANEQKRLVELQRNVRAAQGSALIREVERQTERLRRESIAAEGRAQGRPERTATSGVTTTPAQSLEISLQACNASTRREALAPVGVSLLLTGRSWFTKTRGLAQAYIRGVTVEATVGGVPVPNAERFFTAPALVDHPVLGRVWVTRWEYPFVLTQAPVAIQVRLTLDHRLVDLVVFSDDGKPVSYPAGMTNVLSCTLVSVIAVSGRITGAGVGLSDGRVAVHDATTGVMRTAADTNASGEFSVQLGPGQYRFFFYSLAGPWLPEWWEDRAFFNEATIVTLAFGVAPPQLNVDLERGVILSGLVTDAGTHLAVPGVGVTAQRVDITCCQSFFASTGADGRYRMVVRRSVTLKVGFHPQGGLLPYVDQWWNGRLTFNEADLLVVGTADVPDIDAALERGVFVRGRVTDAETAQPLANVSVSASALGVTCCQNFFASTNAEGEYAMAVRMNVTIVVGFFPPPGPVPYVPSYWQGKHSFSEADHLAVGALDIAGINGALDHGVFMRGRVIDAATRAGVGGVTVYASATPCCDVFFGLTASDGTYTMTVRKNLTLVVQFFSPFESPIPYVTQWYHGRASFGSADPVVVTDVDVATIDAALERGVFLRGRVTEAGTGNAIALANVTVSPAGAPCCENTFASTDTQGNYAVVVRKNVAVVVAFSAPFASDIPYLPQWYRGKPSFATADPVAVGSSDVAGIDAVLERGVFVRGRVTDADTHEGIAGVGVGAYAAAAGCCAVGTFATTDSRGDYRIVARQNVALKLNFSPPFGSGLPYIGQWYHGKASFDAADLVPVGATDASGIDVVLERGVFLRGRVTDAVSDNGLANVGVNAQRIDVPCCEVFFDSTDQDGNYEMTVKRGITVNVGFFPRSDDPVAHLSEWWHDRRSFGEADPVGVGTTDVEGIVAALERGVFVRGHVTDAATGNDLPQVSVNAFVVAASCCENYFGFTDATGNYKMAVRANVSLKVSFYPPFGSDLLQEYYNDKPDFGTANVVSVGVTEVTGIDAALERGVRLSGTVRAPAGTGLAGVSVNVESAVTCCLFIAGTVTSSDGSYGLAVRPGSYKVGFYPPPDSGLLSEYYNDKPHWGVASVVVVGAAPVSRIDATLEQSVPLSGHVIDTGGLGIQGVGVSTSPVDPPNAFVGFDLTDADGNYSIPSRPGDYKVGFFPPPGASVLFEFYNDKPSFDTADIVHVGTTPVTGISAVLEPAGDTTAPLIVDARVRANVGTTDFAEAGDAFTLSFSESMHVGIVGASVTIRDQDGTTVRLNCAVIPNDVDCAWDAPGVTTTVTVVELNVPLSGADAGTTPGMQIPFSIIALSGFEDPSFNVPDLGASPDFLVD